MLLTADRAKLAVPFAGGYRLIDFRDSQLTPPSSWYPAPRTATATIGAAGIALDSIVSSGVVVSGGVVENSVLSDDVFVSRGTRAMDLVLMDKVTVGAGAEIQRAILDKNNKVPAGATIGLPGLRPPARLQSHRYRHHGSAQRPTCPNPDERDRELARAALWHLCPAGIT